tara:strand:+ start:5492 stop:6769 length:1278 start_codon:yes stop_codon:yes gene_type:complete
MLNITVEKKMCHKFTFTNVPKTGVLYVMSKASEHGFYYGNKEWSNLGQGAPETNRLPHSLDRISSILLPEETLEYSPVAGTYELRQAVADLYNYRFRKTKSSQYTAENVAISSGGRIALVRIAATLNNINLGHFLPDYTAYEELLGLFNKFVAIPIAYGQETGFKPCPKQIEKAICNLGLGGILLSNPCNPTGRLLNQGELNELVNSSRKLDCAVIVDEFYSHYLYGKSDTVQQLSAAASVNDVNKDEVVIIDGLTKNWRYPGLRISWTLAPKSVIENIVSAGSFLDGGAAHGIQKIATSLLGPQEANQEAHAIQISFMEKRNYMVSKLREIGFNLPISPDGGFYCFPSLEKLPEPLRDGMVIFKALLKEKVICVPGEFFDVNPGRRRKHVHSRLKNYVRFSYGPPIEELKIGMNRLASLVGPYR